MMDVLEIIASAMNDVGLSYAFGEWAGEPADPYWVGEYTESPATDESGLQEATFMLTGTTRGTWTRLEEQRNLIEKAFPPVGGVHHITREGGVAVFYATAMPVPTDVAELKRMQVNLDIGKWKVM